MTRRVRGPGLLADWLSAIGWSLFTIGTLVVAGLLAGLGIWALVGVAKVLLEWLG